MSLNTLTAHELIEKFQSQTARPEDSFQECAAQIEKSQRAINAYVNFASTPAQGPKGPNKPFPIPIAIKDNICIKGEETTCSSKILKGFRPPYDATVIQKLKSGGAMILGHTNMDEFAFGSSTENSCYGPTINPWGDRCVPGGSSGGSAAAVASHQAIWALGSDTGGSIRQPAAFCGVVGLKPTYGRVSRYGLIAFASSLDQIGPITKDVTDAALLLNIIAGHDPMDSTSVDMPVPDYTKSCVEGVQGLRIGIPKEFFVDGVDPEIQASIQNVIQILKEKGAQFKDVSLPHTAYAVATYYIVATSEASSNLARFDGVRYGLRKVPAQSRRSAIVDMFEETRDAGLGAEAKRRIMLGTYSLSSGYYDDYYLKGLKVRTLIKNDYDSAFKDCDAVLTPTTPTTAFRIGEKVNDPLSMYLSDIFTISANLSGIPAISAPCAVSQKRMPIGYQLMAKPFAEETLFRIAYTFEKNYDWKNNKRV